MSDHASKLCRGTAGLNEAPIFRERVTRRVGQRAKGRTLLTYGHVTGDLPWAACLKSNILSTLPRRRSSNR
jgi:hypothetical protein